MNRTELINALAEATYLPKNQTKRTLEALENTVAEALRNGIDVRLQGFGTFRTTTRKARVGRNPATGEQIEIAASRSASFKPSRSLNSYL